MTADRDSDTKTASRKRSAGKAAKKAEKKQPATLAARRHHTDSHPGEIADIDLNSKYPDPELRLLLKRLKPLLREVIRRSKKYPPADQPRFGGGYHNITVCKH